MDHPASDQGRAAEGVLPDTAAVARAVAFHRRPGQRARAGVVDAATVVEGAVVGDFRVVDPTEVTAAQIRDLLERLREAGQWRQGDSAVLFVLDSGYDIVGLTRLLRDEPVRLLGRIRCDRVMHAPAGRRKGPWPGRQPRHGEEFRLAHPATHPTPAQESWSPLRTIRGGRTGCSSGDMCDEFPCQFRADQQSFRGR
ncbi:transposase [Kitasatospora sp. NPDC018058]|uniref:transposase n=1 Tax=Kitasatospora sp. NPDC018058 TaxID=3364025 RepID=UPI0037BF600C